VTTPGETAACSGATISPSPLTAGRQIFVNRRDRDACGAEWLNQPIEPY
jgi:hypothetical protein